MDKPCGNYPQFSPYFTYLLQPITQPKEWSSTTSTCYMQTIRVYDSDQVITNYKPTYYCSENSNAKKKQKKNRKTKSFYLAI